MHFFEVLQNNFLSGLLYWLVFLISICLSYIYQKSRLYRGEKGTLKIRPMNKVLEVFWIIFIVLAPSLLFGFRDYDVGADTSNYVRGYTNLYLINSNDMLYEHIWDGDPIFRLFGYGVYKLFDGDVFVYLFGIAFFTLYVLVSALNRWLDKFSLPLVLFMYYSFLGMQLLNQSRQLAAISITVYALTFLYQKKYLKYYPLVIIASLTHYTAIIGLFFPFIKFKFTSLYPLKNWIYFFILFISPFIIVPLFSIFENFISDSYTHYLTEISFDGIGMGLVLSLVPIIIPIILFYRYLSTEFEMFLFKVTIMAFPFRFAGYFSYFVMRMYYYGAIASVLIIPMAIQNIKSITQRKKSIAIIIIIYLAYYVVNYMYMDIADMFPYKSILIKG